MKISISLENFKILKFFNLWALRVAGVATRAACQNIKKGEGKKIAGQRATQGAGGSAGVAAD